MSEEKFLLYLRKWIEHNVEHNRKHLEELRKLLQRVREHNLREVETELSASEMFMEKVIKSLEEALKRLTRERSEVVTAHEEQMLDLEVEIDILEINRRLADENRRIFDEHGIKVIDVRGAIGSGKTSLIEAIIDKLKGKCRIGVIAGDVTTTIDADRIRRHGVDSICVNTGKECHLDALLIRKAISKMNLPNYDVIFIENVGNLICPADYPLGAHLHVVVVSVTEGSDMILKHPLIFKDADVIVINKTDLAEEMNVDVNKLVKDARRANPKAKIVTTSVKTGRGIEELIKALGLS